MCEFTPKISCSTTIAPRGLPGGGASQARNSWPSRAMMVVNSLMGGSPRAGKGGSRIARGAGFYEIRPGSVHDAAVAAGILRLVERFIGAIEHRLGRVAVAQGRDAAGGGHGHRLVAEVKA